MVHVGPFGFFDVPVPDLASLQMTQLSATVPGATSSTQTVVPSLPLCAVHNFPAYFFPRVEQLGCDFIFNLTETVFNFTPGLPGGNELQLKPSICGGIPDTAVMYLE
jgi:hypothetical protein